MKTFEELVKRNEVEQLMEYRKWTKEIPQLQFNSEWRVKVIPPFGGAIVRFIVENNGKEISVYLDCYDELGCYGEPYWEMSPFKGDTYRCDMNDTGTLLRMIKIELND